MYRSGIYYISRQLVPLLNDHLGGEVFTYINLKHFSLTPEPIFSSYWGRVYFGQCTSIYTEAINSFFYWKTCVKPTWSLRIYKEYSFGSFSLSTHGSFHCTGINLVVTLLDSLKPFIDSTDDLESRGL